VPTKQARSSRKCTDETGMPRASCRTRLGHRHDGGGFARIELFHHVVIHSAKTVADHLLGQFAADEDDAALARLAVLPPSAGDSPSSIMCTPLEHVAVVIVAEGEDAF